MQFFGLNLVQPLCSIGSALNVHGFSVSELRSLRSDPGGVTTYMHDAARALFVRDAIVVALYFVVVECLCVCVLRA